MVEDFERCYRAVLARDARFDGWFVTAVTSTHIYCRPSCPARTPGRRNVRFHPSAAAAQQAGFRACKRCRPDASPGSPEWNVRQDVVARAMRMISEGVVDRDGVAGLAQRLAYSSRQLNRLLVSEVGTGPLALARAQRAQTARVLIETTELAVSSVAFAAGFASVRQFNDTIREVFACTPTELRRGRARGPSPTPDVVSLRLAHRLPFDAAGTMAFLAQRAVPGVEIGSTSYFARTLTLPHGYGTVELVPEKDYVRARLRLDDLRDLTPAVQRCRRLLDLDADPVAVADHLGSDTLIGVLSRRVPGLRVPGTVDPHELALRAIVGQQVSVASARAVLGGLVAEHGTALPASPALVPVEPLSAPTHRFPDIDTIAALDPDHLPLPRRRARTLVTMAQALAGGDIALDAGTDAEAARWTLRTLPGIGPWTADYIAVRGLGHPDVMLSGDLGVRHALAGLGQAHTPEDVDKLARSWRPWRSYATLHLWTYRPDDQAQAS
ncbi:MAG TPA: DNA-3-methyladenine glycosylase 2 family protein [Acidimicrobiales bacterium]|nr:DNA-3-methyladenine glycosylase 2 family protein [Acidimicrobiales bacterium]